jgi:hypothetical protein
MVDCDYCDASFESEDAYLDHLGEAHEGELGSIDERRVAEHGGGGDGGSFPLGPAILVGVVGFSLAIVVYVVVFMGGGGGGASLPDQGDEAVISQVTTQESEGRTHVERNTDLNYEHMPPTSGPHYQEWATGGFYDAESAPPLGEIVHALEHGAVVVYYDPEGINPDVRESFRQYGDRYTDNFMSFVAVPTPVDDPEATYVLAAWTKRLNMDTYDEETMRQFMAEYLGRGPEQQVR